MSQKKKTDRVEKGVMVVILVVIIAIGITIFTIQFDYNQAVMEIKRPPVKEGGRSDFSGGPLVKPPEGLTPLSQTESFSPETLYEKIDGQAELYLSAGFEGLKTQRFSETDNPDAWLEVYVYDMGSGTNAYSVFSAQRRKDAIPMDIGQFAYRTENALFMVYGDYYVEVIAFVPSEKLFDSVAKVAENFARDTKIEEASIAGLDWFPKENLEKDSLTLIASDAFGFERMDQVYTAEYNMDGTSLMAFISKRDSEAQALELAAAFQGFLEEFGGKVQETEISVKGVKLIEIMGAFDVIFSRGPYFAGVHEASDKNAAERLALRLDKKLQETLTVQ